MFCELLLLFSSNFKAGVLVTEYRPTCHLSSVRKVRVSV